MPSTGSGPSPAVPATRVSSRSPATAEVATLVWSVSVVTRVPPTAVPDAVERSTMLPASTSVSVTRREAVQVAVRPDPTALRSQRNPLRRSSSNRTPATVRSPTLVTTSL